MIYKYLILLCFLISTPSFAADELGRLFLTPGERAQLDIARVKRDQRPLVNNDLPVNTAPMLPRGPAVVTYNGSVRRSDGKSTVWINGKPLTERNPLRNDADVSVLGMRSDGTLSIAIPQAQRAATLKVGQQLDVHSGQIEESYARRIGLPQASEVTLPATRTPAPAVTNTPRPKRPLRSSEFTESDPESGASPAERRASR